MLHHQISWTTDFKESQALIELREWKEELAEEFSDMPLAEAIAIVNEGTKAVVEEIKKARKK